MISQQQKARHNRYSYESKHTPNKLKVGDGEEDGLGERTLADKA